MAKRKKKKRAKYPHVLAVPYLEAVSDNLHQQNPTKQIVFNTLVGVNKEGYNRGYNRKQEEDVRFRQKRSQRLDSEFKLFSTYLDDMIHDKSGTNTGFNDWMLKQAEQRKRTNQQTK